MFGFHLNVCRSLHLGHNEARREGMRNIRTRGQSATEMALIIPLLVMLLSVLIEGGFALNAWIRVNTAARDAVRFAMDAGRPDQTEALVRSKLAGIEFGSSSTYTSSNKIDIYIISGATDARGNISSWSVNHQYGTRATGPKVQSNNIQRELNCQGCASAQNVPFTIVEVDFLYQPLLSTIVARGSNIPMSSYAIVQQY